MPFTIIKKGSGYTVASPNHPEGHSNKPMTRRNAIAQKLIMERAEFGGSPPASKKSESQVRNEKTAGKIKKGRK